MSIYIDRQSGEEFIIEDPKEHYIRCCDCGLVHKMRIRKRYGKTLLTFWRENRRTGQIRRWNNIKVRYKD